MLIKKFSRREVYNPYKLPCLLSDSLNQEFQTPESLIQKDREKIFATAEKEKEFISNKNLKFQIPRKAYQSFLERGMLGEAVKVQFKDMELYLIGTIYNRINLANIYKTLNFVKPDMVLVQMRPDKLLTNINHYVDTNTLDSKFDKLIRKPHEIQPSLQHKLDNKKLLHKNGILINANSQYNQIVSKYSEMNYTDRITPEALSMIALWGEDKNTNIILSDMPEKALIENIANRYTLIQIRQMFQEIFIGFPNNPDYEPRTSLGMAINLYPDVFVNNTDAFIAQSLNKLKDVKKVVAFVGYGQTSSLPLFLNYDLERNSINDIITAPKRYDGLISGEDTLEILCEKWALLYCIVYGVNNNISCEFPAIKELIDKYVRDDYIKTGFNQEDYMKDRMKHLFNSLIDEKREVALEFIGEGMEIKKKEFMKKIFDNPFYNSQLL